MYRGRLMRDLDRWVALGFVDADARTKMIAEYDGRASTFSIGTVLMGLAAVLLSASILLLVAANWQDIPRLPKIVVILALIWIFHLGAAFARWNGAARLASALLILGCASFGAGIALVGQLYHISGDASDAMLTWLAVTLAAALLFRSAALTSAAGLLTWALFLSFLQEHDFEWTGTYPWLVMLSGAAVLALVWWTGAGRARHLVYTLALAILVWFYALNESLALAIIYLVVGLAIFAILSQRLMPLPRLLDEYGAAPAFYALVLALVGLGILHIEIDGPAGTALMATVTVAIVVLILVLGGRDNGAARYLAYAVFAVEIFYLSYRTIDSMLGTSGFFLLSGFVVAALAFAVIRLEKVFHARKHGETA